MKTLIIVESVHHNNTKRIADAIAQVLDCKVLKPSEIDATVLTDHDVIGFGSGIFHGEHHKNLLQLIDSLPLLNKKAFIFSTRGGLGKQHFRLKEKLSAKGFQIIGEFSCKGFDTYGPFKYIGGINRNRPNEEDLNDARKFAETFLS